MPGLEIISSSREELIEITPSISRIIRENGWIQGILFLFCQHTTCGLTINENADPDVRTDLIRFFNEIAPFRHGWLHAEGNTNAHIRSSLLGVSLFVPVEHGNLCLGRWQGIYLYEGDGPRKRSITLSFIKNPD